MSAHTPGPWKVFARGDAFSSNEIRPEKNLRAFNLPIAYVMKLNDGEANARLIAAAPDLLAALVNASANLDAELRANKPPHNDLELAREMRAAIAKARGQ